MNNDISAWVASYPFYVAGVPSTTPQEQADEPDKQPAQNDGRN